MPMHIERGTTLVVVLSNNGHEIERCICANADGAVAAAIRATVPHGCNSMGNRSVGFPKAGVLRKRSEHHGAQNSDWCGRRNDCDSWSDADCVGSSQRGSLQCRTICRRR
jgi:hypothetical protein